MNEANLMRDIRAIICWAFAAAALLVGVGAAQADTARTYITFPKGVDRVEVDLVPIGPMFLVPAQINGEAAGLFLLDTGASHVMLDRTVAEELALPKLSEGTGRAIGGRSNLSMHAVRSISVGQVTLHKTFAVASDARLPLGDDVQLGGIIGNSFLEKFPFTIDFRRAKLILYRPERFDPPEESTAEPMRMVSRVPLVKVRIGEEASGWFLADTGSTSAVAVGEAFQRVHQDLFRDRSSRRRVTAGLGGIRLVRQVELDDVEIWGTRQNGVPVDYVVLGRGEESDRIGSRIGTEVMEGLRLTFWYREQKVWVEQVSEDVPAWWMKNGPDARTGDAVGITRLMRAAEAADTEMVRRLLEAGADVRARQTVEDAGVLHYAASAGEPAILEKLMKAGAEVDAQTGRSLKTPLMIAAEHGHLEAMHVLLAAGADSSLSDLTGQTALTLAAEGGHGAVVETLLKDGAAPNHVSRPVGSALHAAAYHGYTEVMRALIEAGADVASVTHSGDPVLLHAAMSGVPAAVELLLDHGAQVDQANESGHTALFPAAVSGHAEVVELLLKCGADRRKLDGEGRTAFDYALPRTDFDIMAMLYYDAPEED